MYTIQPKKIIIVNILDILKRYSDEEHRLTQAQIKNILLDKYSMEVDRKTIKRNLMDLLELDCGLEYTEIMKIAKNGEEAPIYTDWYINREFDTSELRLIIDSLLFSKHIPCRRCKELISKIEGLSNVYFKAKVQHISTIPEMHFDNRELFYTIDVLDEAISKCKKVSFTYNYYGADKKLHPKKDEPYIINPYQMAAANGRYYLICNCDKYDDVAHYRVDKITNIRLLDEKRKPLSATSDGRISLPKHMAEHIYMFSGNSTTVKFRLKNYIIDQVVDWFGKDVELLPETDETSVAKVTVNEQAFVCWALQYGMHTEVIEPLYIRQRVIDCISETANNYGMK